MINNIDDFKKEHPKSILVNYDMANKFDYGITYRTTTKITEKFRKNNHGKYISYPYIQPYLKLNELSNYELFIIYKGKVYELGKGNSDNSYKIQKEITNINYNISEDDVFYHKAKDPIIVNEPIYIIEE